jgi:nitrogen-specific signal transduction histidine kinase
MVEKNHGGHITFTSAPGRTVFTVEIPKRQIEPAASPEPAAHGENRA